MAQAGAVNVTEIIDKERFGAFQWSVAIWCAALVTLDGFDNAAINYTAPVIAPQRGVPVPAFGPVFGAGLFGLMLAHSARGLWLTVSGANA